MYFHKLSQSDRLYIAQKITGRTKNDLIINAYNITSYMENIAYKIIKNNIPLSKIFQEKFFFQNWFYTNQYTLDPRQESELIVQEAIKMYGQNDLFSILDLGTGTGALCLSLLQIFKNANGLAIDISIEALKVAKINKKNLNINNIIFMQNNWLSNINQKFDLLISNPPYLKLNEINQELIHDPFLALYAGVDPLSYYKLIEQKKYLFKHIILEIHPKYSQKLQSIFINCKIIKDYIGLDRIMII